MKRALLQNASAFCTIKLSYTASDGSIKRIEQSNNRYRIIFKGEQLQGGSQAEEAYVAFNDPFLGILNSAPIRPLDYDYLRILPPAASRLYELLSYAVFAAFKNGFSTAKLRYSDYCWRAPQKRYLSRQPAQNQMNVAQRPHKRSGYISSVRYERTTDEQRNADWFIHYKPGPRANFSVRPLA